MANINVYASSIGVEATDTVSINVYLEKVDPSQLLSELSAQDIYDALVATNKLADVLDKVAVEDE